MYARRSGIGVLRLYRRVPFSFAHEPSPVLSLFALPLRLIHVDFGDHVGVEKCGGGVYLYRRIITIGCEGKNDTKGGVSHGWGEHRVSIHFLYVSPSEETGLVLRDNSMLIPFKL